VERRNEEVGNEEMGIQETREAMERILAWNIG
jgi:hypothetical protein